MKRRVLCVLTNYPTLSQTYKESELRYLMADHEVQVASFLPPHARHGSHFPFRAVKQYGEVSRMVQGFRPDVLHGHYLHCADVLHRISEETGVPFTIRTHSFDILGRPDAHLSKYAVHVNSDRCLGILAFPFLRETLVRCGIDDSKIHDAWPVVDFDRFYDRAPNGGGIMNTGACIPKKNMNSFIDLARMMPEAKFRMFPIGYDASALKAYNEAAGSPVKVRPMFEPENMPFIYKGHQWMVYTANPDLPTIGWPLSIAEAQASGVGVLVHRVREDLRTYVGPGGHVYDSLEEARDILSQPFDPAAREASFDHARRSDIRVNLRDLIQLWEAAPMRATPRQRGPSSVSA